ncbi:23S rRNA (uracil(1939)-C(5))-methyltransferase RlmD [Mycoplasma corogypsi]|uniref:23S rRNA (uracil(1939)-C(5))-methyltransferase RlmD n=1 Tax=Mycoplasma corogypsi TaxID=2106 RepID=UPI003873ABD8
MKKLTNLHCKETSYEGLGTIRLDNQTIFVYDLFEDEIADVSIIKQTKKIVFAKVDKLIKASVYRLKNHSSNIFSAPLINLDYQKQIEFKANYFKNLLLRNTKIKEEVIFPFVKANQIYNYRNKIRYKLSVDQNILKAYESIAKTNQLILANSFNQNKEVLNKTLTFVLNKVNTFYQTNKNSNLKYFKQITLRTNQNNQVSLSFEIDKLYDLPKALINQITTNLNIIEIATQKDKQTQIIYQSQQFYMQLLDKKFVISPSAFFQVNDEIASIIFTKIKELLADFSNKTIIDAFCGVGVISQLVANDNQNVFGVDIEQSAILAANYNSEINKINNAKYIAGDAFKVLVEHKQILKDSIMILDPPRAGLGKELVDFISKLNLDNLIYMSCDPRTLTRDIQFFENHGYTVKYIQGFDMFPNTSHIESVCLITRVDH